MEDLPTLGGDESSAIVIDATSRVWGSADTLARTHAAVWDVDGTVHDLGTLGGTFATVLGVNDSGLAVGFSLMADDRAMGMYVTHPGAMGALPLLAACAEPFIGCTAEAINNIPQAVGSCWTSAPSPSLVVEQLRCGMPMGQWSTLMHRLIQVSAGSYRTHKVLTTLGASSGADCCMVNAVAIC
jgi:hypothetical protein